MNLNEQMPELEEYDWLHISPLSNNKSTLFYFWSISCPYCRGNIQAVNDLYNDIKDQINVVSVHVPMHLDDTNINIIKKEVQKDSVEMPIIIDNEHKLSDLFNNQHLPYFYLFNSQGKLKHFQAGTVPIYLLKKQIKKIS